jgi:hypothetical protein
MKTAHKEQIVMAFVLATGGRLPTDLGELLGLCARGSATSFWFPAA